MTLLTIANQLKDVLIISWWIEGAKEEIWKAITIIVLIIVIINFWNFWDRINYK